MTMDITTQQRSEITISQQNNDSKSDFITATAGPSLKPGTSLKRSFDVAFLMMPDDRLRQKNLQHLEKLQNLEKQARLEEPIDVESYPKDLSPRHHPHLFHNNLNHTLTSQHFNNNNNINNNNDLRKFQKLAINSQPRVYDDPTIIPEIENPKSAFTKVSQRLESPVPAPSLSPGQLSCPSLSPPISTTPPRSSNGSASGSPATLPNNSFYQHFRPEYQFNGAFQSVSQVHALAAQNNRLKQQFMYRPITPNTSPELLTNAGYLQSTGFPFGSHGINPFAPQPEIVRHPAATAVLNALIPPTLASTFSLTAQNVCAKCNISFRMTSDLVYHMRSHHKSEVLSDPNRRKRQEKLKCPVCCESFRERHHLTRHMTAHQDKESDQSDLTGHSSKAGDRK